MALDGCGIVCKYILLIFNIIFALLGMAFLGLGLWLRFSPDTIGIFKFQEFSSVFVTAVIVLIVLGTLLLVVVSFGDYGGCNEKRWALQVFAGLLAFLLVAVIAVGALAFFNGDQVKLILVELYTNLYALYLSNGGDAIIGATLTFIHHTLHCCGITGITAVERALLTCPKPDGFFQSIVMPNCPLAIAGAYESKAPLVMGIFLGIGALLITAQVCAGILDKQLKRVQQDYTAHYKTVY